MKPAENVFVDVEWLIEHRADPRLRIVDARNVPHGAPVTMPSGPEQYSSGHVPGAIYLDYATELADPATPYATRVAPAEIFAEAVGAKGIGDDSIVVAYDAGTIPFAARIVWNFRYHGHTAAYILGGGLPALIAAGFELTREVPAFERAVFRPETQASLRASVREVLDVAEGRSTVQLLETQRDTTYALRDRDIRGAVRLSGSLLMEDANGGRIAASGTLERLIAQCGLDMRKRTIVSCGSGVSAAGAFFALRAAGFDDVAVYDGSWLEWSHDNLPVRQKALHTQQPEL